MPRVQIPTRRIGQFLNGRVSDWPKSKRIYVRDENKKWIGIGWTGWAYEIGENENGILLRTSAKFKYVVLDSQLPE